MNETVDAKPRANNEQFWLFMALNVVFQFFLINKFETSFIFLIPWLFFIIVFKLSLKQVAVGTLLPALLVFGMYATTNKKTNLLLYLNNICHLNNISTDYISQKYDKNLASFINLLIFNFQKNNNEVYKEFSYFGISYILVISGFHLGFLQKLLSWKLNKFAEITRLNTYENGCKRAIGTIVFIILFAYGGSMDFIISGFRIVLNLLLKTDNKIIAGSQTVILTFMLFPHAVISYSFVLSFFIPLIFLLIDKHDNNNMVKNFYKHLGALVFSHVLLLPFSKKLYFLSYINFVIFYPIIIFLFLYYLFFFSCVFLEFLHKIFYENFKILLGVLQINKHYLYLGQFTTLHSSLIICAGVVIYLGFIHNKNKKEGEQKQCLLENI